MATTAEIARGANRNRVRPERKITGRNTTAKVSVETRIGPSTSDVPSAAASNGFLPICAWRTIFSITTMDWSTKIPIANASPPSVMALIESPVKNMTKKDAMIAIGIATNTMAVRRKLRRNTNTTRPANKAPKAPATCKLAIEDRTPTD